MRFPCALCLASFGLAGLGAYARAPAVELRDGDPVARQASTSRAGSLVGRTIDATTGEPVRGAIVTARPAASGIAGTEREQAFLTSHDGRFELNGLEPGPMVVTVEKTGYIGAYDAAPIMIRPSTRTEGVEIPIEKEAWISGRVLDAAGEPLAGITVRAGKPDGTTREIARAPSGVTGSAGEFTIGGLPAGDYVVGPEQTATFGPDEPIAVTVGRGEGRDGVIVSLRAAPGNLWQGVPPSSAMNRASAGLDRTGSGLVAGRVADTSGRGLSRAMVVIFDESAAVRRFAVTDEIGQFAFEQLPAGRFGLAATRSGYTDSEYGAAITHGAGQRFTLEAGQHLTGLTIQLRRLSVVSGVVRDRFGDPMGAAVGLMTTSPSILARDQPRTYSARTDARGLFRIDAVAPGDYVVVVQPNEQMRPLWTHDSGGSLSTVSYVPQFHPGVSTMPEAATFTVLDEMDLGGLEILAQAFPVTSVEVVAVAPGPPPSQLTIAFGSLDESRGLSRSISQRGDRVRLDSVPFGSYRIDASATVEGAVAERVTYYGSADIASDGTTPQTLQIALEPGGRLTGAAWSRAGAPLPAAASVGLVRVDPASPPGIRIGGTTAKTGAGGSFELVNQRPGTYVISAAAPGWTLASATLGGREVADLPFDVRSGDDLRLALIFSDRPTHLAGTARDSPGQPARMVRLLVYPADRRYRIPGSRRIRMARSGADGEYSFDDLPPGEYRLASLPERTPATLERLLAELDAEAVPVVLGEGERKVQDLRVGR